MEMMPSLGEIFSDGRSIAVFLFFVVMAVVWTIVPFVIISMKPVLHALHKEQRRTNELLMGLQPGRPDVLGALPFVGQEQRRSPPQSEGERSRRIDPTL